MSLTRCAPQVSELCHPQTIAVCKSRADGLGLQLVVGNHEKFDYRCGAHTLPRDALL
jgi:hypothetical protein